MVSVLVFKVNEREVQDDGSVNCEVFKEGTKEGR